MNDEVFSEFIENAEIFGDKEKRKKLVNILYLHFFRGDVHTVHKLKKLDPEHQWQSYIDALTSIVHDNAFKRLTRNQELFSSKITLDIVNWLEENYQKIKNKKNIEKMKDEFREFSQNLENFNYTEKDWMDTIDKLKESYPEFATSGEFYKKRIQELYERMDIALQNEKLNDYYKTKQEIEEIYKEILENYKKAMNEKIQRIEQKELYQSLSSIKENLQKHQQEFQNFMRTIGPIMGFASKGIYDFKKRTHTKDDFSIFQDNKKFWDLSFGSWKITVDWNVIEHYSQILEKNEQIQELAKILGRLHEEEEEEERQLIEKTKIIHEWKIDSAGKSEIKGIHFSDNLSSLLPSEVALLSLEETEIIFSKKFVEKKLLTFDYKDRYRIEKKITETVETIKKKKKKTKKGPIIACVDTSGSMAGTPEVVAKSIILALLRIALKEKRDCYLISFSTTIETLEISDMISNFPKLMQFMQQGFYGGTDIAPPLVEALRMLENEKYKKADVVVISDFIMAHIPSDVIRKMELQKKKDTKFHSIVISSNANSDVISLFDTEWMVDPERYDSVHFIVKKINEKI